MISDVKLNLSTSSLNEHIIKAMEVIKTKKKRTEYRCKNFYRYHRLFLTDDVFKYEIFLLENILKSEHEQTVFSFLRGGSQNRFLSKYSIIPYTKYT